MKGNFNYLKSYTYFIPTIPELLVLGIWFIVGVLAGNALSMAFVSLIGAKAATDYGMLVCYPLMFIPAMLYASAKSHSRAGKIKGVPLDRSVFAPVGGPALVLMLSVATLAMSFAVDAVNALLPPMPQALQDALKAMTTGNVWLNLLMVGVFAPVFEEWLCRGMVLRPLLVRGTRPVWAIPVSAAVFALIHMNPWQAVPAFIIGLLFGYVYYKTGSLRLTMLMHCVNNSFAVIVGRFDALKDADNWMQVLEPQCYWPLFAGCLLFVALVVKQVSRIPSPYRR